MSLFDCMLVAHLLGDWIFQTEWQAREKARRWSALLGHVAVYHLILLGGVLLYLPFRDPRIYVAVLALAVSHAWLDRRAHLVALMRTLHIVVDRPAEGMLLLATDQAIHISLLGLAAAWLGRG